MQKIYKYTLKIEDVQYFFLPKGYRILTVQKQREEVVMWVQINDEEMICHKVCIYIVPTGNDLTFMGDAQYIGTFQLAKGEFVGHVFARNIRIGEE